MSLPPGAHFCDATVFLNFRVQYATPGSNVPYTFQTLSIIQVKNKFYQVLTFRATL